jgi:subtilisin family serine protease
MPWASGEGTYCLPGSVILKLALGEAPEAIPAGLDVRRGLEKPASSIDGGPIDRIVRHHAGGARVTRVFAAAASMGRGDSGRAPRYDDLEQVCGVARTFRIDVDVGTPILPLVDALGQITIVEEAAPNRVCVTPFDVEPGEPKDASNGWLARAIVRAPEALAYEPGDPSITCAVIDSGIVPGHPELPRVRAGYDTVQLGHTDVGPGLELLGDLVRADTDPADRYVGHGTGCAGIIGALGLGMPPGLAGEAWLLPMRALAGARLPGKGRPVGLGATSDLDAATKLAIDLNAKVINMSFGTDDSLVDPRMPKPHADVVRYGLERGCILVAASGNSGDERIYWPAAFPGVIAVGAVGDSGRAAGFSTTGAHVALCAPGERVLTAGLTGYQLATGTSFAAPFVAATAALLVARAQRRAVPINGEIVHRLLTCTAQPFSGPRPSGCGAGILDAAAALAALDRFIDDTLPDDTGLVEDG